MSVPETIQSFMSRTRTKRRRLFSLLVVSAVLVLCYLIITPIGTLLYTLFSGSEEVRHMKFNSNHKELPRAIIIGARKCGTRALLKFLQINPAIRAARDEVHFFDRPHYYELGHDWYRDQMPEIQGQEFSIEKSPAYFVTPEVPERIRAMNSSIKLIVILRDPVTRLISDFSQIVSNKVEQTLTRDSRSSGQNDNSTAERLWDEAERDFKDYVLRPDGGIDDQRRAVRIGMYSIHIERWFAHFPKRQIHFVDGELLIRQPHHELNKLEQFLAVKSVIKESHFVFDQQKGFYCLSNFHDDSMHHRNRSEARCLNKNKGRRHVKVDVQLKTLIRNFYQPYNEYLRSLVGLDLNLNMSFM